MNGEHIITDLKKLCESDSITKNELLDLLKRYAETISIYDQMMTTARLRKDGEYITSNYRDKYLKIYIENFIMRIKEVLMKTVCDNDEIDNSRRIHPPCGKRISRKSENRKKKRKIPMSSEGLPKG